MLSKIYKLTFDLSICFMIVGFILRYYFNHSILIGDFFILLFTALVVVIIDKKSKVKYIPLIVVPLLYLIITSLVLAELIIFLIIWTYLIYVIRRNQFDLSRGELLDMIRHILIISLILIFPMLADFTKFSVSMKMVVPYLVCALVSTIFLLRNLRVGNEMEQMKTYEKQQFIELATFLFICLLLTLLKAPVHVLEGAKLLYQYIIIPVLVFLLSILGALIYVIINLVTFLYGLIVGDKKHYVIKNPVSEVIGEATKNLIIEERNTISILPILYSVGAILAIAILFFFFRWLRGRIYIQNITSGIEETRESLDIRNKSQFSKSKSKNSREAVRFYYGKYMIWLQTKQLQLNVGDTTRDIDDKYKKIISNQEDKTKVSEEFSKLYKEARYQMTKEITEEDAARSKGLYQLIKSTKIRRK